MVGGPAATGSLPGPGARVAGKYRIERIVGRGGMGVVYAAHHEVLDQRVAIKVLAPEAAMQSTAVARFLNEARLAARLKSDHLCQVIDAGVTDAGLPFIVMELLEGCDLARLLYERRAPLPVGEATEYVVQALDAVAEAHARGVVHRDLKPSNLFLTQHPGSPPVIKVLDFGISKVDDAFGTGGSANPSITSSRAIIGSPTYMSPEQIQNIRKTDHRADIWSIGVILYELMSGTLPFRGETPGEIFVKIIEGHVTPLCKLRKEIPVALSDIVEKCLRRSLHERFEKVVDLAEALAPFAWYKHHESLARMRRTVAVRGARSMPPGTSSHSVPAAVRHDTGNRTTGQTGTPAGTKVLLGIAAAVPLLILPIAAVLVVHRSAGTAAQPPAATVTIAPASAQTSEPVATTVTTLAPPATATEPAATATQPPPVASETPSATATPEVASAAPPAETGTAMATAAPTATEAPPVATVPATRATHAPPPSKRSILQQRY